MSKCKAVLDSDKITEIRVKMKPVKGQRETEVKPSVSDVKQTASPKQGK